MSDRLSCEINWDSWDNWRKGPGCGWCCQTDECRTDWLSHPNYSRTWGNYFWVNLAWVGALHKAVT